MSNSALLSSFRECLRYKDAKSWQKALINPKRFVVNQLRKRGFFRAPLGQFEASRTFHLPSFTVVSGENVSEIISSYGIYEPQLTEAFLHLIKPGQTVVDVGMHLGYYTTLFAGLVGSQGQVHAFEPTPSTRELALHNTSKFPQIFVHPYAVWSSEEVMNFKDYGIKWMAFNSFSGARAEGDIPEPRIFQVQTKTLNQFRLSIGKTISLIKIDAESAEYEILRGAQELLLQDRPLVSLEVGDAEGEKTSRKLIEFMQSLDYAPWEFESGAFKRHVIRDTYTYDNLMFAHKSRLLNGRD